MPTRTIGRFTAGAILAVGLLFAMALPASATSVTLDFAAGSSITINGSTTNFGGVGSGNVCAANGNQNSVTPDFTGGVIDLDAVDYTTYEGDYDPPPTGGTIFRVQLVPVNDTTGSISGSNISIPISVKAVFKNCAGTSTVCETNTVAATLSTSSYAGSNPPASGDTATLNGTSGNVTTKIGCNVAIRSAINGFPATVSLNVEA